MNRVIVLFCLLTGVSLFVAFITQQLKGLLVSENNNGAIFRFSFRIQR